MRTFRVAADTGLRKRQAAGRARRPADQRGWVTSIQSRFRTAGSGWS